ncbi:MAG: hypothetical protein ISP90_12875 [Nevskia sp.]|nr:hypothetical protein [Nevskia sp.]
MKDNRVLGSLGMRLRSLIPFTINGVEAPNVGAHLKRRMTKSDFKRKLAQEAWYDATGQRIRIITQQDVNDLRDNVENYEFVPK